jgi:large subunit ribosomal protein L25
MSDFEVVAELRTETGTGPSRRYRKAGKIPAVLYGAEKEATSLLVNANEIGKQLENEAFFSHILTVKADGRETQAVLKAMQRDPATAKVAHMDFLRVSSTQEIQMNVPLHFINEDSCPGMRAGGVANHLMVDLVVSCLPKDLPEYIDVDMGAMELGTAMHLSEITLPDGVRLSTAIEDAAHDHPVVTVQEPQKLDLGEEPEEEAVAEGLEGEGVEVEGEEGPAPAEGEGEAKEES